MGSEEDSFFEAMLEKVLKALKEIKAELGVQSKGIQSLESATDLQKRPSAGPSLDSSVLDLLPLTTQSSLQELEQLLQDDTIRAGLRSSYSYQGNRGQSCRL
ncbi:hypothetical protein MTO96_038690 [Rhipicephalus appendiculatus]